MCESRCSHCGAVNVQKNGTCLTFKSDGDLHFFAQTGVYQGRCRSCLRSFRVKMNDMLGQAGGGAAKGAEE